MKKLYLVLYALILAGSTEAVLAQGVSSKTEEVKPINAANDDITSARADSERLQKLMNAANAKQVEMTSEFQSLIVSTKAANNLVDRNEGLDKIKELALQINQQAILIDQYSKALVANAVRIEALEKPAG